MRFPPPLGGLLLTDPSAETLVQKFMAASPDRTIYHQPPYLEFARAQNHNGDVLLLTKSGQPQVALPLHAADRFFVTTGYSGVLLPDTEREQTLRACLATFTSFLEANPAMGYTAIQSVQARAYANPSRAALLDCLIATFGYHTEEVFSRVLTLTPVALDDTFLSSGSAGQALVALETAKLENSLLAVYDGDARNQIRQALKAGLSVEYCLLRAASDASVTGEAYRRYLPVHEESWQRTGLVSHAIDYWTGLSRAIQKGGGIDLVVFVLNGQGRPVAGVSCHVYEQRAIYWSGCSTEEGKAKRANPLCLHAAISLCAASGANVFELGRFNPREADRKERAVNQYKAQFRGQLLRVVNFRKLPGTRAYRMRHWLGARRRSICWLLDSIPRPRFSRSAMGSRFQSS